MYIKAKGKWQTILDFSMIILGTIIMGFAFSIFLEPRNISTGGFSGLSMLFNVLLSKVGITFLNTSIIYFILNIGLFIYAFKALGKKFAIRALLGISSYSLAMQLFTYLPIEITYEPLVSAMYGGALMGIGIGLVVRFGGSTGGSDMIACVIKKKNSRVSIGTIVLYINIIVIILSIFAFNNGLEILPYTILALGLSSFCTDFINDGYKQIRAYYIITNKPDIISEKIMKNLARGCTASKVVGMHSLEEKTCLLCLVSKFQSAHLNRIVRKNDPEAFMFATKVSDFLGNFNSTSYINKQLENIKPEDDYNASIENVSENIENEGKTKVSKSKKEPK